MNIGDVVYHKSNKKLKMVIYYIEYPSKHWFGKIFNRSDKKLIYTRTYADGHERIFRFKPEELSK